MTEGPTSVDWATRTGQHGVALFYDFNPITPVFRCPMGMSYTGIRKLSDFVDLVDRYKHCTPQYHTQHAKVHFEEKFDITANINTYMQAYRDVTWGFEPSKSIRSCYDRGASFRLDFLRVPIAL